MALVKSVRAQDTLGFWHISRAWHNAPNAQPLTVQIAMDNLNDILASTPDGAKLSTLAYALKNDIVKHGTKEHKQRVEARSKISPK